MDNPLTTQPHIEVTLGSTLNLADFQNAVPLLKALCIVNETAAHWQALELRATSQPAFFKPRTWHLDAIAANDRQHLLDLDMALDSALLAGLTEAVPAVLTFSLLQHGTSTSEPVELARQDHAVELLPRNQWGGLAQLPEMIAAFVQPNEPAIARLLRQASDLLHQHGCDPSLNGYQGGARHAWEISSALWSAVANLSLTYALPPTSFEQRGQKIRGSQQVVESGLATCLDTTLLLCSALEQAGLHALVVFTQGHAFAGVWLRAEEFSTCVVDDITALRKRVSLKELVLFETTLLTHRPAPNFETATDHGARQIAESASTPFVLAVDVRRARLQRIRPMASLSAPAVTNGTSSTSAVVEAFTGFSAAPAGLPDDDGTSPQIDPVPQTPEDRLTRWQRKLLDLSLRNNLLNFRSTKSVKLEAPEAGTLEDWLSNGKSIRLLARPTLMDGRDPRDQAIHEGRTLEHLRRDHAREALQRGEVFIDLADTEMDGRLLELYRSSRATLQDSGANTLFLAVGFLRWTPADKSDSHYRAPLLLLPVTLARQSVRSGFSLTLLDDEARFNPTLIEMLKQDFELKLGISDQELPRDDAGFDIAALWKQVSAAIKNISGWEVSEEIVLSTFSFAKYLMWKDLADRTDQLRASPVVRHLLDTPRDPFPSSTGFPEVKRLDRDFSPRDTFCPLPADSSQLSAVMAASRGKDFVLIGPPGTGKSQTIANLMAQSLAEGRRVLFVSEKAAALDVVHRRLREVGLGEFCLELHSSKASKAEVLAQLRQSWDARGTIDARVWQAQSERLQGLRTQLNGHAERMHHVHPNGMTLFRAIGITATADGIPNIRLGWSSPQVHDLDAFTHLREVAARMRVNRESLADSPSTRHALAPIGRTDWSPGWQQAFATAAQHTLTAAVQLRDAAQALTQAVRLPAQLLPRTARMALGTLANRLPQAHERDWRFTARADADRLAERLQGVMPLLARHRHLTAQLCSAWPAAALQDCRRAIDTLTRHQAGVRQLTPPWPQHVREPLERGLGLLAKIKDTAAHLSSRYDEQTEQLNVAQLAREWTEAENTFWPISALRLRKLRKTVEAHALGDTKPEVGRDLRTLSALRILRADFVALDIDPLAKPVWHGLKTDPARITAALALQTALRAAASGQPWNDAGFDGVADGLCGESMAEDLRRLRTLHALERDMNALQALREAAPALWTGPTTDLDRLAGAERFQTELAALRQRGTLQAAHEAIGRGDAGPAMAADWQHLRERAETERQIAAQGDLNADTAGLWAGLDTPVASLEKAVRLTSEWSLVVKHLAAAGGDALSIRAALQDLLGDGRAALSPSGAVAVAAAHYLAALPSLAPALEELARIGELEAASKHRLTEEAFGPLIEHCEGLLQSVPRLNAWCAWRKVRGEAVAAGLAPLVEAVEADVVQPGMTVPAFDAAYARWWLHATVDEDAEMRAFVSAEHEQRITDFRALDERFTALTRDWIRARLCGQLPSRSEVPAKSDWGLLNREMTKKRNHLPLRTLMEQAPGAMGSLAPCMLMSPLSIAQYLSASTASFDLVVFDEASQIPVWDAIGAIARGRQVVMVGDPKQLPPTSFFNRAESDSDQENVEGDMESILDECIGANLPCMNLSWHYRSRHESLIAFSNQRYYGGGLVTFPSPVTHDSAVSFHHVAGTYAKGGARTNQDEAKALVADLVTRLKSPDFRASRLTVGIVTFNAEQQRLIENLLDEERRQDASIEPYFADTALEPVFVKNLESVQGDERDIMYFSITYGPDVSGAVSMNFGPMNRSGGERRLNVAITRARHELRVFSTLLPEQINLGRTQARGVTDLKHFLEFAQRGASSLGRAIRGSLGGHDSPFEQAVAEALVSRGWELHTQIGVSSFRIDLAVVHPDAPGLYLTGIECDGATYHRSATARDRDKLREQVLRGLGWEIVRIWSTDWWIDRAGTLERVHQRLETLLAHSRERRAVQAALAQPATPTEEPASILFAGQAMQPSAPPAAPPSSPVSPVGNIDPEAFFDTRYAATLRHVIREIVDADGPILDATLVRRVARTHGWQRVSPRIHQQVTQLAADLFQSSTEPGIGAYFWPTHHPLGSIVAFRDTPPDQEARPVEDICLHELAGLARDVSRQVRDSEMALTLMARRLGLQRLRASTRERLMEARALACCG